MSLGSFCSLWTVHHCPFVTMVCTASSFSVLFFSSILLMVNVLLLTATSPFSTFHHYYPLRWSRELRKSWGKTEGKTATFKWIELQSFFTVAALETLLTCIHCLFLSNFFILFYLIFELLFVALSREKKWYWVLKYSFSVIKSKLILCFYCSCNKGTRSTIGCCCCCSVDN